MLANIVDYTDSFLKTSKVTTSPSLDIRRGKFVVLEHNEEEVCIFSPIQQSEFHANIVERYITAKGVQGHYNNKQDKYYIEDDSWTILGGGYWEYIVPESRATLFGKSLAYGGLMLEPLIKELMEFEAFDGANIFCA
ncbi:hypothetical protein MNBD_GAMMA12-2903 [hydrothermal vent metagenome]|uniref:Uncharacterized protein n=1 Tax=hydrothermal vent metagenome TaxID=652676 RepID=A0A3B0YFS8_9ZZZZ